MKTKPVFQQERGLSESNHGDQCLLPSLGFLQGFWASLVSSSALDCGFLKLDTEAKSHACYT